MPWRLESPGGTRSPVLTRFPPCFPPPAADGQSRATRRGAPHTRPSSHDKKRAGDRSQLRLLTCPHKTTCESPPHGAGGIRAAGRGAPEPSAPGRGQATPLPCDRPTDLPPDLPPSRPPLPESGTAPGHRPPTLPLLNAAGGRSRYNRRKL